jgi:hypothetical protein
MARTIICGALLVPALLLLPVSAVHAQSTLEFLCSGPIFCVDVAANEEMRPFQEEEPPEDLTITILLPTPDDNFAFDSASTGKLEIDATALVRPPEYADEVEWEASDIGRTKATVSPARGQIVKITYEGLPERNNRFGNKTITAKVRGKSAKVRIQVFFNATAKNHPGEDAGSSPNWFHYWKQTEAAQGHEDLLGYTREFRGSNNDPDLNPIGRYILPRDRLYLTDLVESSPGCTDRSTSTGGPNATGIDCFAEIVAHEWQHRDEEMEWWDGLKSYYGWVLAYKMMDWDWDGVPRSVEQSEPGCRDDWLSEAEIAFKKWQEERIETWYTCTNRPFAPVTDRELYAYQVGWGWGLGTAYNVDWSEGGKQW